MNKRLNGIKIAVTRPAMFSDFLRENIEALGGDPVMLPAIGISPLPDLESAVFGLGEPNFLIFVSRNAARIGGKWLLKRPAMVKGVKVFAVGEGTKKELVKLGYPSVFSPTGFQDSQALLDLPPLKMVKNFKVIICRGKGGKELLARELGNRGAFVEYFECYQRKKVVWSSGLVRLVNENRIAAWVATSGEIMENIFNMHGIVDVGILREAPWFVTHPILGNKAISKYRIKKVYITCNGDLGIVEGLSTWF